MNSKSILLKSGMSLIELMIVIVIIGILGGLLYPNFQKLVKRARQTEAKNMLHSLYMSQQIYKSLNDKFTDSITELDIDIPQESIYKYTIIIEDSSITDASSSEYIIQAEGNIDDDDTVDRWIIDSSKKINNTIDDVLE